MQNRYLYKAKAIHILSENKHLDGQWITGFLSGEDYITDKVGEHLIDFTTICQCTGIKDKDNRLIWENDIVECVYDGKSNVRKIIWDESELDFKGTNGKDQYGTNFDYLPCCEELVVIGNIYDNPELLN